MYNCCKFCEMDFYIGGGCFGCPNYEIESVKGEKMSGGSFNYGYLTVDKLYTGKMCDEELNKMMKDLNNVLHDLEWWKSCDYSEEQYRETVDKFKNKWLKDDEHKRKGTGMTEKSEKYKRDKVDEIIGGIRNKVLHAFNCGYEVGLKDGKAEPCSDAISRQAAIDAIYDNDWRHTIPAIRDLPSVHAVPKIGHWIDVNGDGSLFRCNKCLHEVCCKNNNYCPNCGAKMEDVEDDNTRCN